MEDEITTALCAILQLYINKQKKVEDELKLLLFSYELEESNVRYYESIVKFLLFQESSGREQLETNFQNIYDGFDYNDEQNNLLKRIGISYNRGKENRKNIYIPKYEWTEDRTQRLLDSLETHYPELIKNKDYAKPVWENVRLEVDASDPHLKWYTCRHKWSHLESDYNNYIKDLKEYTDRNSIPELMLYVPQHYKQIGNILRSVGNQNFAHNQISTTFLQKILEDKIGEALKTSSWEQLGKKGGDNDEDDVITICGVDIGMSDFPSNND